MKDYTHMAGKKERNCKTIMDIYEIKRLTKTTCPYFFSNQTMRFFGQNMTSFKVTPCGDRFKIHAPIRRGMRGVTIRYFNPKNNELEWE